MISDYNRKVIASQALSEEAIRLNGANKPLSLSGWDVKAVVEATAFVDLIGDSFGKSRTV